MDTKTDLLNPLLLDVDQVLKILSISRTTLYKLIKNNNIPEPIKLGKRTLWRPEVLKEWVVAGCPKQEIKIE